MKNWVQRSCYKHVCTKCSYRISKVVVALPLWQPGSCKPHTWLIKLLGWLQYYRLPGSPQFLLVKLVFLVFQGAHKPPAPPPHSRQGDHGYWQQKPPWSARNNVWSHVLGPYSATRNSDKCPLAPHSKQTLTTKTSGSLEVTIDWDGGVGVQNLHGSPWPSIRIGSSSLWYIWIRPNRGSVLV